LLFAICKAVPRSLASSISPVFACALLVLPFSGLPLVLCGSLKIIYDVALLFTFRHVKPPEEKTGPSRTLRSTLG
jgi:hypothetical protein